MSSMSDRLHTVAPLPAHKRTAVTKVDTTVSDIERILALPKRSPIICERNEQGQYPPITQALIEVMTDRFARRRVSCACRERFVTKMDDNTLAIARVTPKNVPPTAPIIVPIALFLNDLQKWNDADRIVAQRVAAMARGETIKLPSADMMGHPCITTLNAVQSWLLYEAIQIGGIVGYCGVGSGKSFAFLLAPLLWSVEEIKKAVLLIEPKQRIHYRSQYLRLREHFQVPSLVPDDGAGYTVPGTIPLRLISYSVLSQDKNSDLLEVINPDLLEGDEFHRACGNSAINRRVKRFALAKIQQREQALARGEKVAARAFRLIGASGTLESESVSDTQMICAFSLGMGSPLPLDPNEAWRWSQVIDPARQPDIKSKTAKMLHRHFGSGEIDELYDLGGSQRDVREGFRERRLHTPGIISASASSINATIYISERKPPKMPRPVYDALMKMRTEDLRPDGVKIEERVEQISTARHIACGFYTFWKFKLPCSCQPPVVRCANCLHIDDWYLKRKTFYKALRAKLIDGELNEDSEKLCRDAAERFCNGYKGPLPVWDCPAWVPWRDIEDTVQYDECEKWIEPGGDWLARDAAQWALENTGVVWFQSIAFGRRVAELSGLPYFNGGPGAEQRIRAEKGDRSIICSIKAHGAGTDGLQNIFNHQLVAETPASNAKQTGYEQLLGRLHREGQPKKEVFTEIYAHVRELKDAFLKALEQADFNFEMTGNKQKLLVADKDLDWVHRDDDDDC